MPNNSPTLNTPKIYEDLQNTPIIKHFIGVSFEQYLINIFTFIFLLGLGYITICAIPYLIQKLYFHTNKTKIYSKQINFNPFINYNDLKFQAQIENIFKSLSFITKNKAIIAIDLLKIDNSIKFVVSSDNQKILANIISEFVKLEGSKVVDLPINFIPNINIENKDIKVSSLRFGFDNKPIEISNEKIFTSILETLKNINNPNISGVSIILKTNNAIKRFRDKQKHFAKQLQTKEQSNNKVINENLEKTKEKSSHGEIFTAKIYVYSNNKENINLLASSFTKTKTGKIVLRSVLFTNELFFKFIPNDYYLIKPLLNYNYLNSHELSKIIIPISAREDLKIEQTPNFDVKDLEILTNNTLINLTEDQKDILTIKDINLNIMIFGDPDSGKSSGFMGNAIDSILSKNFGGLFTTYKQEESFVITELAKKYNRLEDIILINPNTKWRTNIINQELENSKSIGNLISKIEEMNRLILRKDNSNTQSGDNEIWEKWANELNQNILKLSIYFDNGKYKRSTYTAILNEAIEFARYLENPNDQKYEKQELLKFQKQNYTSFKSKINQLTQDLKDFETIKKNMPIWDEIEALETVVKYFTSNWLNMNDKQRESVFSMVQVNLDSIRSGFIGKLLLSDEDNPDFTFKLSDSRNGKIIILDLPVSTYSNSGRVFQEVAKLFWQDSMRIYNQESKQCFLLSDEFQEFGARSDVDFSSINRSAKVGMIYATQNYSSLELKLGETQTRKLLGNFQTKVFFQTSEKTTWQYARELHGEVLSNSYTNQLSDKGEGSLQSQRELELLLSHFQQLNMRLNDSSKCEAIVFKKGYLFNSSNKNYLKVEFKKIDQVDDSTYKIVLDRQKEVSKTSVIQNDYNSNTNLINFENDLIEFVPTSLNSIVEPDLNYLTKKEIMSKYKISIATVNRKISDSNLKPNFHNINGKTVGHFKLIDVVKVFEVEKSIEPII